MISAILVFGVFGSWVDGRTELDWVRVSKDGRGFTLAESGRRFTAWGFNYDHDEAGDLIEDYWDKDWKRVEEDFREMKDLGANVVRIHLQLGKFMKDRETPDAHALGQLRRLLTLAVKQRLYLDLTGLGCYHRKDVPAWYDVLSEEDRWKTQACFWEAVARTCRDSPAVFCYDLMNEPVVSGGKRKVGDWLGPPFGGKHFVQFITLDPRGRKRPEVARAWIKQLVQAIRREDRKHLVTVGLVDWSLDRPGLTSGFVPSAIHEDLDLIAVHLYPKSKKVDEALETLKGFAAVGKPVLIEETFPLQCSRDELAEFIDRSSKLAAGHVGFYWGKTLEEHRRSKTLADAIMVQWLEYFQERGRKAVPGH